MTNLPELGVISTQQEDWLGTQDSQPQEVAACSSSVPHLSQHPADIDDEEIPQPELYENDLSKSEAESDEEVMQYTFNTYSNIFWKPMSLLHYHL